MHSATVNRDQAWAGSAGAGNALLRRLHGQRCQPASDHREFQSARHATSLVRRNLAGATCSGPFIRVGWAGDLNTIAALRIRKYSGLDERAATHIVEAEHSSAPGHFQCFPERNSHSSKSLPSSSSDASKTTQKRRQELGHSIQRRGDLIQAGAVDD